MEVLFLKMEIDTKNEYFSILLHDKKENLKFWVDCSLIDEYGNKTNNGEFIDWDFNQYIFLTDNENDIKIKEYQEAPENIDKITDFIDENTDFLIEKYKEVF